MKKLLMFAMLAMGLSIFNACEKNDEIVDQSIDEQLLDVTKPDVYSENGYLVFKDIKTLDSIATIMNKKCSEEQTIWEQSLKFESARMFRANLNEAIFNAEDFDTFLRKSNEGTELGYYNEKDSSMCYPFSIYSWASVLNKDGIIKIDDQLYSFDKNGQIIIHNGTPELIKLARIGAELPSDTKISRYTNTLKSVILGDYGNYYTQEKMNGSNRRLRVYLNYNVIKVNKVVYDPSIMGTRVVSLPDAVKIDLYCHQQNKGVFGWSDKKTHLYYRGRRVLIGGNYVSEENFTYGQHSYSNPNVSEWIGTDYDLANHYINLYYSWYPFELIENQPAPPSPRVDIVDFDIFTGQVGSESDFMHYYYN